MWFRQDLRLADNPALEHASKQGRVLPLYIQDTDCPTEYQPGGASNWWLHHSLHSLNTSLDNKLHCLSGSASQIIEQIVENESVNTVVWNRCYEPWQIQRDKQIKQQLKDRGIKVISFNGALLWEPWEVLKQDGTPYKVFTPYYRKGCLGKPSPRFPLTAPQKLDTVKVEQWDEGIDSLQLHPNINWYGQIEATWSPGEQGAKAHLQQFLPDAIGQYKADRDFPDLRGTSRLSPHLHFGEISPHQIWYAAIAAMEKEPENQGLDCYLSELGWREFSHYLLYHFPELPTQNFNPKFDHFPWRQSESDLLAWQQGLTGIPIIDAGMRELWQTGYMHNRVRMVVGSFLVKNLLLDWRHGERWFWDCLLDADLPANSASWQWVAGSGADAAPYFRIFNPVLQGEKFDKQGEYVSKYCPELAKLPPKYIHQPWTAPDNILQYAGVRLGDNYPKPIVDLKASRQRALDALAASKEVGQ